MADEPLLTPTVTPPTETPSADAPPPSALDKALDAGAAKDPAAVDPKDASAQPAPAVPEKYSDFTLPEGFALDEKVLGEATGLFKEAKLPQDVAQKFVDFHTKAVKTVSDSIAAEWRDMQSTWVDELNSDPKIGKGVADGTVGASIAKMLTHLPVEQSAAFRQAMNFTGAGNNPAIVRALFELSQKFTEPGHVQGAPTAQAKARPTPAQALYPSSNQG